jgi:SOS-response transcriptional repressor LexA
MLTKQQHRMLLYVDEVIRDTGSSPTYREIAMHLNLASPQGVRRMAIALIERGFLAIHPGKARSMTVLKLPPGEGAPTASELKHAADIIDRAVFFKVSLGPSVDQEPDVLPRAAAALACGVAWMLATEGMTQ